MRRLNDIKNFFQNPRNRTSVGFFGLILLLLLFQLGFILPPFPEVEESVLVVKPGSNAKEVVMQLDALGVLRSARFFSLYLKLTGSDDKIYAGRFIFGDGLSAREIANKLKSPALTDRITLVPGWDVNRMAKYFSDLEIFTEEEFTAAAAPYEGYLYPDTYEVSSEISPEEVVALMRTTFDDRMAEISELVANSDKPFEEVVVMASIIEREAAGEKDRNIISGILWKRIANSFALQVDATLTYITGKGSAQLSVDDIRTIDSPYNTYQHLGLPPTPIGNPSIASIKAALEPKDSPYWYYLHASNRNVYYARTFDEHKHNKFTYLR